MKWFNNTPTGRALKSYLKTFLATVMALYLTQGTDLFSVSADDLKGWVNAGVAAVLPLIITALDPTDFRFGNGKNIEVEDTEEFDPEEYQGELSD